MKMLIFKALMVVFIVIAGINYLLYIKTGRAPWGNQNPVTMVTSAVTASLDKISHFSWGAVVPSKTSHTGSSGKTAITPATGKMYKWRDEHGQLHFGEKLPDSLDKIELLPIGGNINVVEYPEVILIEHQAAMSSPESAQGTPIEQALQARDALNKRHEQQVKALNGL